MIERLQEFGFSKVWHTELASNILWPRKLLKEHAEIQGELKRLKQKSPDLSEAFRRRLEQLLKAVESAEVRSGSIYALYTEK
jgi:hypothetical protein